MTQSEAQKRAHGERRKRRLASGARSITVWIEAPGLTVIERHRDALGSREAVVNAALAAYQGPGAAVVAVKPVFETITWGTVEPVKAVSEPEKRPAVKAEFSPHPKPGKGPKK